MTRRRQALHQAVLALRYGFDAEMYYRYRLYRLDDLRDAAFFVPKRSNIEFRRHIRERLEYDVSLNNKDTFATRCQSAGLPAVPLVASFEGGGVRWGPAAAEEGEDRCLPTRDLFSKPVDDYGGRGAARWQWDGSAYAGEDGALFSADALLSHLRTLSLERPYVLQPRLVNAPALARLSSGALCTIRIMTARVAGQEAEHVGSFVRMATGDGPVDNFDAGGLAAPVDAETGVLGSAVWKKLTSAARDVDRHPVTGHVITGSEVPRWHEALALALRAHETLMDIPVAGWDVAVTTDGVFLLEVNTAPCVLAGQQPGQRPLGATAYTRAYLAGLGGL